MKIKSVKDKNAIYLYMYGELDECSAKVVRESLDKIFEKYSDVKQVVFNFSNVDFMDSTGIGMLLGRYKKLKSMGVTSYIQSPNLHVERIIEISGLYKIMPKI